MWFKCQTNIATVHETVILLSILKGHSKTWYELVGYAVHIIKWKKIYRQDYALFIILWDLLWIQ